MARLPLLFASLVLLLGVGTAGAFDMPVSDTWVPVCWEKAPKSSYYHPCSADILIEKGWIEQRHLRWFDRAQDVARDDNPCLAKMEQAMRAEHPFLNRMYSKRGAHWVSAIEIISQETMDKQEESTRLWYEAKACWTK